MTIRAPASVSIVLLLLLATSLATGFSHPSALALTLGRRYAFVSELGTLQFRITTRFHVNFIDKPPHHVFSPESLRAAHPESGTLSLPKPDPSYACSQIPSVHPVLIFHGRTEARPTPDGYEFFTEQSTAYLLPGWVPALPLVWVIARQLRSALRRRRFLSQGKCPTCGYDLRATPAQCPECGTPAFAPPPSG